MTCQASQLKRSECNDKGNEEIDYSFYSMSHKLAHFKVGTETFTIHEALLDTYSLCWSSRMTRKHDNDPWTYSEDLPTATFRAMVHWLYYQEIPRDETITQSSFPEEWSEGLEEEPIACSLAISLYFFAQHLELHKLTNDAMTLLFTHYKKQRIVPSLQRVEAVFDHTNDTELHDFCADIYYKLGSKTMADMATYEIEETIGDYPEESLFRVFHRHCQVVSARSDAGLPLMLAHYHVHCTPFHTRYECNCGEERPENIFE